MTLDALYKISLLQDLAITTIVEDTTPSELRTLLEKAARIAAGNHISNGQFVQSVFSVLQADGQIAPKPLFFHRQAMTLGRDFFPQENPTQDVNLSKAFQDDFNKISKADITERAFAETLLHLLHKYTSAVPSGKGDEVSLYDFAKSKAGIALCLWRAQNDPTKPDEVRDTSAPLLLIGGGVSGIQTFIYDIVSTNASKNLKGRSYYLHLLVDSAVQRLLRGLDLRQCNVVTASGGNFQLLAPNTAAVREQLAALKETIGAAIFEKYKTALNFELEWTPVPRAELEAANISRALGRIKEMTDDTKKRKHWSQMLDENGYAIFFNPSEIGGEEPRDVITGDELTEAQLGGAFLLEGPLPDAANEAQKRDGANLVSRDTAQQIYLGRALRSCHARFTAHGKPFTELRANLLEEVFEPGGLSTFHYILDEEEYARQPLRSIESDFLSINDLEGFSEKIGTSGSSSSYGFELYGGNRFPQIEVENKWKNEPLEVIKTFSELAGMSDDDANRKYILDFEPVKFKRLAILRMDVDNLGSIFREEKHGTFARYYALSRQLDWFFKGYLNTLWEQGQTKSPSEGWLKWQDHVQITYAGGDDLFIVGKWDCVLEFAVQIREQFEAWTCQHPGLHISGGITIVMPKHPIYAAASQCEKDEKRAKKHRVPMFDKLKVEERLKRAGEQKDKNAFTLFGVPLRWDNEFQLVLALRDELKRYYERMPVKAFLQQIQSFEQLRDHQREYNLTETWRWQLAYQIARSVERYNLNAEAVFREIPLGVFSNKCRYTEQSQWTYDRDSSRDFLTFLSLAARWVEFEYRFYYRKNEPKVSAKK